MTHFLLLLTEPDHFEKWDAADEAERERAFAGYRAFSAAVSERGTMLGWEAPAHPDTARTVRPEASAADRPVTDGPFAETVEQLGGFYLIDVPSQEVALEVAALLPREYSIEVRECLDVT